MGSVALIKGVKFAAVICDLAQLHHNLQHQGACSQAPSVVRHQTTLLGRAALLENLEG